jgi:uncharacterized protein (TIRG00374 family)
VEDQTARDALPPGNASAPDAVRDVVGDVINETPKPAVAGGGKQLLKQLIGAALAIVCVVFAFRGIDLAAVWTSIQKVNPVFVAALVLSTLISHWLRAMRWVIMLQPLSAHKVSTWNAFCAVMYGYAINIPIPRGGEVARVVAISKSEKISWVGVVPTMLIDRLLDFAMLVCAVGLTLAVLPSDLRANFGFLVPAGVVMCLATVVGLALLPRGADIIRAVLSAGAVAGRVPEKLKVKLLEFATQFEQGTRSLSNPVNVPIIGLLSFGIWGCYFLNFYFSLLAFSLTKQVDMSRAIISWTISSVSVIAPTPGCVGTFHIACKQALNMVAGVDPTEALAFATLVHAVSFVVVPVVAAAVCFLVQNLQRRQRDRQA